MIVYDSSGHPLRLGSLLGKGGEGTVYDLEGSPSPRVVKLYHRAPPQSQADKLRAMAAAADAALMKVAAWPLDTVHNAPHGALAGIVMPKVSGYAEIHLLYSPAHRRNEFAHADWGHLVHAARNVAAAVETVHANGHVIGDVNQKNVTVAANATVMLVDCDGFQIARNGTIHECGVGVAHFTPPELQGRSFHGVVRTANHDAFGLAVLCFHLLFMGRHPFAGRYLGGGDMPLERAIAEFRFSFGTAASRHRMQPPPGSMSMAGVPQRIATLFEQAFGESTRDARPAASQWRAALEELARQLRQCSRVAAHKFFAASSACTWCDLEGRTGVIFFLGISTRAAAVFDITAAWVAVEKVAPPRPLPPPPTPTIHGVVPQPVDRSLIVRRRVTVAARVIIAIVAIALVPLVSLPVFVALLLIVIAYVVPQPGRDELTRRKAAFETASEAWRDIQQRWMNERRTGNGAFGAEIETLRKHRDAWHDLGRQYAHERAALESAKRARQLEQFLDRFFIDQAKIAKVGAGRKATLASFGIETAADLTYGRLDGVPGFGPALVAALMAWRASLERRFTFDPSKEIDPAEIARLDRRFEPRRRDVERALVTGPARLAAFREQLDARRARLSEELHARAAAWAQAKADLDAFHP